MVDSVTRLRVSRIARAVCLVDAVDGRQVADRGALQLGKSTEVIGDRDGSRRGQAADAVQQPHTLRGYLLGEIGRVAIR
jgi:hypothetical protein